MRTRVRGTSLIELIVSAALVGMVMLLTWYLMVAGKTYFLRSTAITELQRSTLVTLNWMSRELSEGNIIALRDDTDADPVGFVFSSPRDENGEVNYEGDRVLWPSIVCYYIDTSQPRSQLIRAKLMRAAPYPTAPPVIQSGENTNFFATSGSVERRVLAKDITELDITVSPNGLRVEMKAENIDGDYALETMTLLDMKN